MDDQSDKPDNKSGGNVAVTVMISLFVVAVAVLLVGIVSFGRYDEIVEKRKEEQKRKEKKRI